MGDSTRNIELGSIGSNVSSAKSVGGFAAPYISSKINKLREEGKKNWLLYTLYLVYAGLIIGLVVIDVFTSRNQPIMSLSGSGCTAGNLPGGEFKYYMQMVNGMCTTELTLDTRPSDCISWSNSTFWEYFATKCKSSNQNCGLYIAGQAHDNAASNPTLNAILLAAGVVTGVLKSSQTVYEWFIVEECSIHVGFAYRMTVALLSLGALFTCFLFSTIGLSMADDSGVPHGNQISMTENWQALYSCHSVDKKLEGGYYQFYTAVFFGAFSTLGALIFCGATCCCKEEDAERARFV